MQSGLKSQSSSRSFFDRLHRPALPTWSYVLLGPSSRSGWIIGNIKGKVTPVCFHQKYKRVGFRKLVFSVRHPRCDWITRTPVPVLCLETSEHVEISVEVCVNHSFESSIIIFRHFSDAPSKRLPTFILVLLLAGWSRSSETRETPQLAQSCDRSELSSLQMKPIRLFFHKYWGLISDISGVSVSFSLPPLRRGWGWRGDIITSLHLHHGRIAEEY